MTDISSKLVEQVADARRHRQPLRIVGGGSKAGLLGRDINNSTTAELSVKDHCGIVNYDPSELVITARAGTPLTEIEQALSEHGQMLSFESPQFEGATLGGSLACDLSGPARPWRSSIRDMVLGVRLINGRGEHLRFGGQVMKNVAGYDLARLQAGALGSLGVISEISLKVLPILPFSRTLGIELAQDEAIRLMNQIAATPAPLIGGAWLDGCMYLRFGGAPTAVDSAIANSGLSQAELIADEAVFWDSVRNQSHSFFRGELPLWRFSIKSTAASFLEEHNSLIDWAGAQRWVSGDFKLDEMEAIAARANGHVCLYRGGDRHGEVRQRLDAVQQRIQQQIKLSFDPARILNPGVLYAWM